jgi:hypothetical protein
MQLKRISPGMVRSFEKQSLNKVLLEWKGTGDYLGVSMKRLGSEVIGSLFWIGIGICFALGGVKLNIGEFRNPGAGFLPTIMGLIMICISTFTLIKGLLGPISPISQIAWRRHSLMVASVFFYALLLDFIGFLPSTFVFMLILFGLFLKGERKWPKVFLYSTSTALAAWLLFSMALSIPFPFPRLMAIWR